MKFKSWLGAVSIGVDEFREKVLVSKTAVKSHENLEIYGLL